MSEQSWPRKGGARAAVALLALVVGALGAPPARAGATSTSILVSEFRFSGPGGGSDEFVELYNASPAFADIGGWQLRGSNSAGSVSVRATVPAGTYLAPHRHYLFTNASSTYTGPPGDLTYSVSITADGGVAVTDAAGSIIDEVGLSSGSAYGEGTPLPSSIAASKSYERKPGGRLGNAYDIDDNESDFFATAPSPQSSSAPGAPANPAADFDGSGTTEVAVFRPSGGLWFERGQVPETTSYGTSSDIPVAADYDGDTKTDIAIFRPSTALWAIRPSGGGASLFVTYGVGTRYAGARRLRR